MAINIVWYGHACFRLRERNLAVVTDPYSPEIGFTLSRLSADVVTVSHHMPGHDYVKAVRGKPLIFDGPGEYEVHNVFITAIRTWHKGGKSGGPNTIFHFLFNNISVLHLGDIGEIPSQDALESIGNVDVLLLPVGGKMTLDASSAVEMITFLEPRLVVPMHYHLPGLTIDLDPVDYFLSEVGAGHAEKVEELKVTASSLPSETNVVLLRPKVAVTSKDEQ